MVGVNKVTDSSKRFWIVFGSIFAALFFFLALFFVFIGTLVSGGQESYSGNVAVISIEGAIVGTSDSSAFGGGSLNSLDYVELIESANLDDSIEAIVLEINSPGGSAVASDEVAQAVMLSSKPVVAQIREVGASGGYWIASSADYVIANRMSITGSIGVISSYLEFTGLMEEYGVAYERLVAGESKDIGVPFRELADDEREILQRKLTVIHDYFIDAIAANRGLNRKDVVNLATGEFYLGVEALELGLVDELGSAIEVEQYLYDVVGLEFVEFVSFVQEPSFLDGFFGVLNKRSFNVGLGIAAGLEEDVVSDMSFIV